ncbi:MAG: CBS domain-containing protein [Gemmatimonadota bacterium]|jgi:CBS domain-containing protein
MKIREILRQKGHEIVTIAADRSVVDAVKALVHHDIGSLLVMKGDAFVGIVTERDVLRLTAESAPLGTITVGSVMSRELIVAAPEDDLHACMTVMTENRVRHLPVMEGRRLVGIVSIGDLVNACRIVAENENVQLRHYIHGGG